MSATLPNLKPMTAGDVLDQAIRLYRQNFVGLVTIVGIVSLPVAVFQAIGFALLIPSSANFNNASPFSPSGFGLAFVALSFGLSIVAAFFGIFELGAVAFFVSERFLDRPVTVWQAYRSAFKHGLSLFIAAVLLGLAYIGVVSILGAVFLIPIILAAVSSPGGGNAGAIGALAGAAGVLCLCLLFFPTLLGLLYVYTRWTFWTQAIMLENYNSTGGLGRSWKLVKGNFWRVLLFNVLLAILIQVLAVSAASAMSVGAVFLANPSLQIVLQTVVSAIISVIVAPLQFATLTVLYYDLRIRKEGFDLQMQMQDAPLDLPSLIPGSS